jgi:hypothetical protein
VFLLITQVKLHAASIVINWMVDHCTLQNGGSGGIVAFGVSLFQVESLLSSGYGCGFIRVQKLFLIG